MPTSTRGKTSKRTKYPEFDGIEAHVWQALNTIGRPIPAISRKRSDQLGNPDQLEFANNPIWHEKGELDEFVAREHGLDLNNYLRPKNRNQLRLAIADEIKKLRNRGILIDWRTIKGNSGMGIWRLDKTKFSRYILKQIKQEMKEENFSASGLYESVYVRTKQELFREILIDEYCKCALCGFNIVDYTIGAHIVPYSIMRRKDPRNSMNPSNGLLLCRMCDLAFEKGMITINEDREVAIASILNVQKEEQTRRWLKPIPKRLPVRDDAKYPPSPEYLGQKLDLVSDLYESGP